MNITRGQKGFFAIYAMLTGVAVFVLGFSVLIYHSPTMAWQSQIAYSLTIVWVLCTSLGLIACGAWIGLQSLKMSERNRSLK